MPSMGELNTESDQKHCMKEISLQTTCMDKLEKGEPYWNECVERVEFPRIRLWLIFHYC